MRTTSQNNLIFLIMVMISSLGQIMSDMYLPSLPAIERGLQTSVSSTQFSLSIYMFGFALSILVYGPLSDGIGRRKPLLLGLCFCLIGSAVCLSAQSIQFLIIGRLLQGLGAGCTLSVTSPLLRDLFSGETLARYASYSALIGVGFLTLAPLLGGYLQHYFGWRASFVFLSVYCLCALIAMVFVVPETNEHRHSIYLTINSIKTNLLTIISSRVFIGYTVASLLAYGALLAWLTSGPIVLQSSVGLSSVAFGWVYVATGLGFAAGAIVNSVCIKRFGLNNLILFGFFCIFIAGIFLVAFASLQVVTSFAIVPPAILLLFGVSFVFPNSSAGVFQPFPHIAGLTSALFYATRMLSGSIFSAVIAWMPDHNQLPMGLALIVSSLLAWIIVKRTLYQD